MEKRLSICEELKITLCK